VSWLLDALRSLSPGQAAGTIAAVLLLALWLLIESSRPGPFQMVDIRHQQRGSRGHASAVAEANFGLGVDERERWKQPCEAPFWKDAWPPAVTVKSRIELRSLNPDFVAPVPRIRLSRVHYLRRIYDERGVRNEYAPKPLWECEHPAYPALGTGQTPVHAYNEWARVMAKTVVHLS